MSLKTYPETPAEEAARINRASGDPEGITAEQVANNRQLNESLTAGFGFSGTGASIDPLSTLVGQTTTQIASAQASAANFLEKASLDNAIGELSGAVGTSLSGFTSIVDDAQTALGGITSTFQSTLGSISNITSDISGTLNKLTGGNLAGGLQESLSALSGAAGMTSNVLSLLRGASLPAGGELFLKQTAPIKLSPNNENDWRVKIDTNWDLFGSNKLFDELKKTGGVVFPYLPNITVSTKANYTSMDTTHSNYPFQSYKNSQVDEISISCEFSAETDEDAAYWLAATTFFKTATKMFFGNSANAGNPPIICRLSGYGAKIFNNVPVIVKSFSVDLKDDVNYVRCEAYGDPVTWVPVLSTITVGVSPIYNRASLRQFKLEDYARGEMITPGKLGYL